MRKTSILCERQWCLKINSLMMVYLFKCILDFQTPNIEGFEMFALFTQSSSEIQGVSLRTLASGWPTDHFPKQLGRGSQSQEH